MRLLITALFLVLLSCSENDPTPLPPEYIKIKTSRRTYLYDDSSSSPIANRHLYDEAVDQLYLTMKDNEVLSCEILIFNSKSLFDKKIFPFTISSNDENAFGIVGLYDFGITVDTLHGVNDDVNFEGDTHHGLTIEISDFEDGLMTGKIHGVVKTGANTSEIIESGEFRLKVEVSE
jgi:hypothetical protein